MADISVVASYHNDTSKPLRDIKPHPLVPKAVHENENPHIPNKHKDTADPVVQKSFNFENLMAANMPSTILSFNGIGFPGVACNCAPPDTNGEVGATQYVQMVNEGIQVFDKTTGASVLGPVGITTIWNGFNGPCETAGDGDPVVPIFHVVVAAAVVELDGIHATTVPDVGVYPHETFPRQLRGGPEMAVEAHDRLDRPHDPVDRHHLLAGAAGDRHLAEHRQAVAGRPAGQPPGQPG